MKRFIHTFLVFIAVAPAASLLAVGRSGYEPNSQIISFEPGTRASSKVIRQRDAAERPARAGLGNPFRADSKSRRHLDVSVLAGAMGLGVDFAMPVNEWIALRLGYTYMPSFKAKMSFGIQVGDSLEAKFDPEGNPVETKFDHLAQMMEGFTGYRVDDRINMYGRPTYHNFRLQADVTPFRNKAWHFTAGLFFGPKQIARAYNTTEDMPSLVAVGIFNNMYDKAVNWEPISLGGVSIDPFLAYDKFAKYGRMNIHVGDFTHDMTDRNGVEHKKGEPYLMVPDDESMVKATMKVNTFRPYLGFGYGGRLVKGCDDYWVSFDCGALFWGGTPHVYTHDGVDLTHDVENVTGSVGKYVDAIKVFKVFPVVELRLTRRFTLKKK